MWAEMPLLPKLRPFIVFQFLDTFECEKCLETGETTKSLEYGKCLEIGETAKSLEIMTFSRDFVVFLFLDT